MAGESWRIVLVSVVPQVVVQLDHGIRAFGHEPVAVITRPRMGYPGIGDMEHAAPDLDLVVPSSKERLAPLFRAYEPDLMLCFAFPWLIPQEALDVPRLGAANMHPSLLPRYRGPNPLGWAWRNDDSEYGLTVHRMAATFDTGGILAQTTVPVDDDDHVENLGPKFEPYAAGLLARAFERLAAGDPGDPQSDAEASEAPLMEDEWAEIDWSRTAREVHNQVRSWMLPAKSGIKGALTSLDGERVRVVRTRLDPHARSDGQPGETVERRGDDLLVQCSDGPLWVIKTEPPD